jgi:hypothetical protein
MQIPYKSSIQATILANGLNFHHTTLYRRQGKWRNSNGQMLHNNPSTSEGQ